MSQRLFDFPGNDVEYIRFLESQLITVQPLFGAPDPISTLAFEPSQNTGTTTDGFRFVEYKPQPAGHTQQRLAPDRGSFKWKKQLDKFVHAIPISETQWNEARNKAGIDTVFRNQEALKLILGHSGPVVFHENQDDIVIPSSLPTNCGHLITQGCQYGSFIARCADDRNFAVRVVAYQNLVFCSYCVVMMRAGVPKAMTNEMMKRYTGQDQDDQTLEKYRHGALWVNRCAAALLENGWGCKSWEIFLLENRTLAQFARFAANDASSYQEVVRHLGKADIPLYEEVWTSYCIPSIVYHLTSSTIHTGSSRAGALWGPAYERSCWLSMGQSLIPGAHVLGALMPEASGPKWVRSTCSR
ncbi:hypothetical protein VN97_g10066 [Penicillium thymicola]|uniref:Uncharacterized protein n=1 Tax=Penicillium thymicola TaxID=293382 RepID=A0AAI9X4A8_PENTH|nr:hypothetical protein VN97_g10066 [Penicillium thymicola]